jgi:hypothetical protein
MLPGPELDAEVARKILGVVVIHDTETGSFQLRDMTNKKFVSVPPYSTDTATAHSLVSRYKAAGCAFAIKAEDDLSWSVAITHPQVPGVNFGSKGTTLPHAICQAILQFNSLFKLAKPL